jgi:sugar phosphate isomerase/epimerase
MTYRLGVVEVVFAPLDQRAAARVARDLGFDHFDTTTEPHEPLALPVVDRYNAAPRVGWSCGALPDEPGNWDRAVRALRRTPGARIEPWPGSIINTTEKILAFLEEVPDVTLLLDTGHIANWGEDPVELLPFAGHVQLRQARRGVAQSLEGDVDFAALFERARRLDYRGAFSVEYFNLPDLGYPLDDPVGYARDLAGSLRALL